MLYVKKSQIEATHGSRDDCGDGDDHAGFLPKDAARPEVLKAKALKRGKEDDQTPGITTIHQVVRIAGPSVEDYIVEDHEQHAAEEKTERHRQGIIVGMKGCLSADG